MGIKEKLDAAGYDVSNVNEADLIKKLDSAGYDTSSLGGSAAPSSSPEITKQEQTVASLKSQQIDPAVISAQEKKLELLKAGKPLPYSLGPVTDAFNTPGEHIATSLASNGTEPHLAAAVGTAFQMIPHVVASVTGEEPIAAGADEMANSAVVKALTPGAKATVGKAIGTAEKEAGIVQQIPTVSNMAKRLDLPARERSFADIVNAVKGKLDKGEDIAAQDLTDFRDLVRQKFGEGKITKGTRLEALTSQANKRAGEVLNEIVPNRAGPAADYAKISKIQNGLKTLAKAGAGASGIGLAGAILRTIIK